MRQVNGLSIHCRRIMQDLSRGCEVVHTWKKLRVERTGLHHRLYEHVRKAYSGIRLSGRKDAMLH